MNLVSLRCFVLVVSGCLIAAASVSGQDRAPHPEVGRPRLTNFTPADYEAEAQNWALVEDDRGIIYVGNDGGVLEYDGLSWRLLQLPNRTRTRTNNPPVNSSAPEILHKPWIMRALRSKSLRNRALWITESSQLLQ